MPKIKDLTGERFGFLTVVSFACVKRGRRYWNCICDCGNETLSPTNRLTKGEKKSCGCYKQYVSEHFGERVTTHNYSKHPLYTTYMNMKNRCYNKNNNEFKNYGGRGIVVCDEWLGHPDVFIKWALSNGWKEGLTIDRINVNDIYKPSNCRWVSRKVQGNNTTRNVNISFKGKSMTATEWSEQNGWEKHLIAWRIRNGWSVEKALTIPPKLGNRAKQRRSYKTKEV